MRVIMLQTTLMNHSSFLGSSLISAGAVTRIGLFVNPTCRSCHTMASNSTVIRIFVKYCPRMKIFRKFLSYTVR